MKLERLLSLIGAVSALAALSLATIGCNTSEGFGEDVEDAGEEVQDWAN